MDSLNEGLKVHIWQLPEKIDDIDKSNDYTILHDKYALKKISMNNLYEYFNQNHKIDNVQIYIENIISTFNEEYNKKYSLMISSLDQYEETVKELTYNFETNRNNIRDLEARSKQIDRILNELIDSFEDMNNKITNLGSIFTDIKSKIKDIQSDFIAKYNTILILSNKVKNMDNTITNLYSNLESMNNQISDIKTNIDSDITYKRSILLKSINDEYDKILNIIDYYHHIHDTDSE